MGRCGACVMVVGGHGAWDDAVRAWWEGPCVTMRDDAVRDQAGDNAVRACVMVMVVGGHWRKLISVRGRASERQALDDTYPECCVASTRRQRWDNARVRGPPPAPQCNPHLLKS